MADEPDPKEGEPEADTVPAEDAPAPELHINQAPDPVATLAAEMGWLPQDQYRGDPEKWKPPADFIKAGRDINRGLSRDLHSVREEVSRISRTSAQLMADKIAERDAYWTQQQTQAIEDGNHAAANRAIEERIKLKSAAPGNDIPPETTDFIERNKSWFGVDPLATMHAKQIAEGLAREGISVPDQLRQAERAVRKQYPELFPAPAKQPASVQTGQARNTGTTSRRKGFADMPHESQKMAQDFNKRHGVPLEKFAENYWDDLESQRRAG